MPPENDVPHKPGYHEIASIDLVRLISRNPEEAVDRVYYGKALRWMGDAHQAGDDHQGGVCGIYDWQEPVPADSRDIHDCPVAIQDDANILGDTSVRPGYAVFDCYYRCPKQKGPYE